MSPTKAKGCDLKRIKISNNDGTKFGPHLRHSLIDNSPVFSFAYPLNTIYTFVVDLSLHTTA